MRVFVFADKGTFYKLICIGYTFCIDSFEPCSQIYKRKFHKFKYNNLFFFFIDLFNNRLKMNGCVEKYYGKVLQKFTYFNILHHAAISITHDFIFTKMRVSIIIPCPFLAKPHLCLLILHMSKLGHKYNK